MRVLVLCLGKILNLEFRLMQWFNNRRVQRIKISMSNTCIFSSISVVLKKQASVVVGHFFSKASTKKPSVTKINEPVHSLRPRIIAESFTLSPNTRYTKKKLNFFKEIFVSKPKNLR